MTRFLYPDAATQLVYVPPPYAGAPLGGYPGLRIPVYVDAALTTPADIQTTAGASLGGAVTVGADSQLPDFLGPDGVDTLYVTGIAGSTAIHPRATAAASTVSAASTVVQQTKVTGDAYARYSRKADGGIVVSDGTVDPAMVTGSLYDLRGRAGELTLRVRAANDGMLHDIQEWADYQAAPIAWMANAGGFGVNDELYTAKSVLGPDGVRSDIYGFLKQLTSAEFRHAGPPGNMAAFDQATAEVFNGSRGASMGDWGTVFGLTNIAAINNPLGGTTANPGETFHIRQLTHASGSTLAVFSPAAGANGFAVAPGNKIRAFTSVRSPSGSRTFTATIQYYDSGNSYLSSSDLVGSGTASSTSAWTVITVGGTVPVSAAKAQFKLSATGVSVGEVHWECGFGVWIDTRTSGAADPNPNSTWSPPLVAWPGLGVYTGMYTGDRYWRTDTPATANQRLYVLDGTPGTIYAPGAVGAPGSTATPRWLGIL